LVDGQASRVLNRKDTWNATANRWAFPQTPARVQLSLWPAGLPTNGKGTIDWAGGLIDWNSPLMSNGYYYATFESLTISCYNAHSAPGTNTGVSYTYDNVAGTNDTVVDGNKPTVLKSLLGTGTDLNAGDPGTSASASGSSKPSSSAQSIPGLTGGSPGSDPQPNSGGASPSSSSSPQSGSSGSSSSGSSSGGGFSQFGSSGSSGSGSGSSSSASSLNQERALKGSLFAAIVAVVAMVAL
jgi:hypothetical protein